MINSLITWIKTQAETVTELNGKVYEFEKENPDAYPIGIITFESTDPTMNSLKTTYRKYEFRLSVQYAINNDAITIAEVDSAIYDIVDELLDIFDKSRNAGDNADLLVPSSGRAGWLDTDHQIRYCDIRLKFFDIRDAS